MYPPFVYFMVSAYNIRSPISVCTCAEALRFMAGYLSNKAKHLLAVHADSQLERGALIQVYNLQKSSYNRISANPIMHLLH